MGPHPIPQNVTSFQFKLVGDMTLKQFLYLASGLGTAYLTFVLLAVPLPAVAWPIIILSSLLGIAFAFLPIAYRPLDQWVVAFFRAVYSPTKRVWSKNGKLVSQEPLFNSRLALFLPTLNQSLLEIRPLKTAAFRPVSQPALFSSPKTVTGPPRPKMEVPFVTTQVNSPADLPSQEELQKTVELARQAQLLQVKIVEQERRLNQIKQATARTNVAPADYSQEVNKILESLQKLVNDASFIKHQLFAVGQTSRFGPTLVTTSPTAPQKVKVKITAPTQPKQTQLTLTSLPNVINGIVTDAENNYLEGVVVVIYDKEGLPVRALKTNKLGQFSGSTPLPNDTYTVELEKDNLLFDALQIELAGQILLPLRIAAKKMVNGLNG